MQVAKGVARCSASGGAMIYKFKSKAGGDVLMLGPNGDALIRTLGREPAAKGIIEPAAMAAAITAIENAVALDDAARAQARQTDTPGAESGAGKPDAISLRQRFWPMVDLLQRAQGAQVPVVWGV